MTPAGIGNWIRPIYYVVVIVGEVERSTKVEEACMVRKKRAQLGASKM